MDLSIIIVNYRAWSSLSATLDCLKNIFTEQPDFEVVVVDNCSGDGKLSRFAALYPSFKFIENTGNWGFADACNLGARSTNRNCFLFLNPDTLPNKAAIVAMYNLLMEKPDYGLLGCLQNDRNELKIKLTPNLFTLLGFTRMIYRYINRDSLQKRSCSGQQIASPDWISGSIVMISRTWFEKSGGWDADYWLYSEDTDLSRRVAGQGGKIRLLCTHKMIHRHGGASRVDWETTAITKSEVKISSHVYIQKHFTNNSKLAGHTILILSNLFFNLPVALTGLLFFFIAPLRVYSRIYGNLLQYYLSVIKTNNWISPRSKNFHINRDSINTKLS